jgi:transcriptional regulator with XRE-family HTH domain
MITLTRLKLVRQRRALTQQQLAEKAGLHRVTIARLEGGRDQPVPTTVRKLADALGVAPEELMDPSPATDPPRLSPRTGMVHEAQPQTWPALAPVDMSALQQVQGAGDPGVRQLLSDRSDLATLVQEAIQELLRVLPTAGLTMELLPDPDYGEGEQLFLGVSTTLPEEDAQKALRRFDRTWWVQHAQRADGLLCIDLLDR